MSYLEPDPPFLSPEPEESDSQSRRPSGCMIAVTVIVIVALVGSSAIGILWFLLFSNNAPATPTPAPIVAATITAIPATRTAVPQATEASTIVPEPTPFAAAASAETDVTLENNRIAFVNNEGQVVTIAPDGTDARTLTASAELFQFPAWSPDGDRIAVISNSRLGSSVNVLADEDTVSDPESLYFGDRRAPFYLYWSPDSETISFLANEPDGMGLHLVAADGSMESRLRTSGGPFYWHWTSDSEEILIHSGFAGSGSRLELIEAEGEDEGPQVAEPGFFQTPHISNSGQFWAYAEQLSGLSSQLIVENLETGDFQSRQHAGQIALGLSPVTHTLAYISPLQPDSTDFVGPLRLMNMMSGKTTTLSSEPVAAFFWSPDGRYLAAFAPNRVENDEDAINAALFGKGMVAKPAAQLNLPELRLIVFDTVTGEGRLLETFTPTISFLTQFMPFFDQYALSHRIWSPDSQSLVLPFLEGGRSTIYIVPANGGPKRFLAQGSMSFWSQQ